MEMSYKNEIRNILINEFGLTRESIRIEMEEIINSTVEKHFNKLWTDGRIEGLLASIVSDQLRIRREGFPTLRETIHNTAKEVVAKLIDEHVKIFIK